MSIAEKTLKMNEYLIREMNLHKIISKQEIRIQNLEKLEPENKQMREELQLLREKAAEKSGQMIQVDEMKREKEKGLEDRLMEMRNQTDELKQRYQEQVNQRDRSIHVLEENIHKINSEFNALIQEKDEEIRLMRAPMPSNQNNFQNDNPMAHFDRSLDNYTTEAEYIVQLKKLDDFISESSSNLMAQIVHYRRELEVSQRNIFSLNDIYSAEKDLLSEKLIAAQTANSTYEKEMNTKLRLFESELKKLTRELNSKNAQLLQATQNSHAGSINILDQQIEGEKLWMREKAEVLQQIQLTEESYEKKIMFFEKQIAQITEEKIIEIEKYVRENEILRAEKELMLTNMEDLKKVFNQKEQRMNVEIDRLTSSHQKLMELSHSREQLMQQEIQQLNISVIELQSAYELRNKLITVDDKKNDGSGTLNWHQLLSSRLTAFDKLNVQMRNALSEKKTVDVIKEGRTLIAKLADKISFLDIARTQQFEKRASEKRSSIVVFERSLDKLMQITDEFSSKIDLILAKSKELKLSPEVAMDDTFYEFSKFNESRGYEQGKDTNNNQSATKRALAQTKQAAQAEIESTKYDEILTKKDADINIAKRNILIYKETIERLEGIVNQKVEGWLKQQQISQINDGDMEEEHIIASLSCEKILLEKENVMLKKEVSSLRSEKEIAINMRDRYEARFLKEAQRIEEQYNARFLELKKLISTVPDSPHKPNLLLQHQRGNSALSQSRITTNQSVIKSYAQKKTSQNPLNQSLSKSILNGGITNFLDFKRLNNFAGLGQQNNFLNVSVMTQGLADGQNFNSKEFEKQLRLVFKEAEQIKSQLKEIEKVYLENERFNNLLEEIKLLEARNNELADLLSSEIVFVKEQLEQNAFMASVPSKKFDEGFDQFQQQCHLLIELKDQIMKDEEQRQKFFTRMQDFIEADGSHRNGIKEGTANEEKEMLRSEIASLTKLIEIERQNHQTEIEVTQANISKAIKLMEKKVDSAKLEIESLKNSHLETISNHEQLAAQQQKEIKQLKFEIHQLSKLINESHVKRVDEKKKFLSEITSIEKMSSNKDDDLKKGMEARISKMEQLIEQKEKIIAQKYNWNKHEDRAVENLKQKYISQFQELLDSQKNLNRTLKEQLDEVTEMSDDKSKSLNNIINDLRIDLENAHQEKQNLLECINYHSQLINHKDKQLASYSQRIQNLSLSFVNQSQHLLTR